MKSKGVGDQELRVLEQPCSYLDVQQRNDKGKGTKSNGKAKSRVRETPLTPLEEAERERQKLEREVGEFVAHLLLGLTISTD
jgi:hypothetical protein